MYIHNTLKCKRLRLFSGLFEGLYALTCMLNKLVEQIVPLPVGSELLEEAVYAFALLANANTDFNQGHGES